MRATMMLCDAVQVAEGKLYILGGGWSVTGPEPAPSAIAIKVDVDWHEADRSHHWELYLVDADGRPVLVDTEQGSHPIEVRGDLEVGRPDDVPEGIPLEVPLAINFGPLPLPAGNRYTWKLAIDGESDAAWSLSFSTRPAPG